MSLKEQEEVAIAPVKNTRKFFLETYGCQMNFSDSEIVTSILNKGGYTQAETALEADLIFMNTCAVRENAEERIRHRLQQFRAYKRQNPSVIVGLLGCMAERLKEKLLEEEYLVDIVVGPDAYRSIPGLIEEVDGGQKAVNVLLSKEETYDDINPVRPGGNGILAFISIMRGCDNMCSFCVVPFTRGRERSRNPETIVAEAQELFDKGYREVTLLGQNVDSFLWDGGGLKKVYENLDEEQKKSSVNFAALLEMVAKISPLLRVRFSTSNPQDMTDEVLHVMAKYNNICKSIHLPIQSGNSRLLQVMNRGYDREKYLQRIKAIRTIMPECGISTDIISGFCTETEEEHQDTISLIEEVKYDLSYMFKYSERPGTLAARKYKDDVPEDIKSRRLEEMIVKQRKLAYDSNVRDLNKTFEVLVEGVSKKSPEHLYGRNTQNKVIVFPRKHYKVGEYVKVKVSKCTSGTLIGEAV